MPKCSMNFGRDDLTVTMGDERLITKLPPPTREPFPPCPAQDKVNALLDLTWKFILENGGAPGQRDGATKRFNGHGYYKRGRVVRTHKPKPEPQDE